MYIFTEIYKTSMPFTMSENCAFTALECKVETVHSTAIFFCISAGSLFFSSILIQCRKFMECWSIIVIVVSIVQRVRVENLWTPTLCIESCNFIFYGWIFGMMNGKITLKIRILEQKIIMDRALIILFWIKELVNLKLWKLSDQISVILPHLRC